MSVGRATAREEHRWVRSAVARIMQTGEKMRPGWTGGYHPIFEKSLQSPLIARFDFRALSRAKSDATRMTEELARTLSQTQNNRARPLTDSHIDTRRRVAGILLKMHADMRAAKKKGRVIIVPD